jgi:hypothetical protein
VHPRAHLQRRAETGGATGLSDGRPLRALGSLRLPKPETIAAGLAGRGGARIPDDFWARRLWPLRRPKTLRHDRGQTGGHHTFRLSEQAARHIADVPKHLVREEGQVRVEYVASGTETLF